jgi:hypothetical protein
LGHSANSSCGPWGNIKFGKQKRISLVSSAQHRITGKERFFIAVMFSILDAVRNRLMETSGNEARECDSIGPYGFQIFEKKIRKGDSIF